MIATYFKVHLTIGTMKIANHLDRNRNGRRVPPLLMNSPTKSSYEAELHDENLSMILKFYGSVSLTSSLACKLHLTRGSTRCGKSFIHSTSTGLIDVLLTSFCCQHHWSQRGSDSAPCIYSRDRAWILLFTSFNNPSIGDHIGQYLVSSASLKYNWITIYPVTASESPNSKWTLPVKLSLGVSGLLKS